MICSYGSSSRSGAHDAEIACGPCIVARRCCGCIGCGPARIPCSAGVWDARARPRARDCARRQPLRRRRHARRVRLPAAKLCTRTRAALCRRLLSARLHGDRRGVRAGPRVAAGGRPSDSGRRTRDDPRAARRVHGVERQHVLEFADHGRLGELPRAATWSLTSMGTTARSHSATVAASAAIRWAVTARCASA